MKTAIIGTMCFVGVLAALPANAQTTNADFQQAMAAFQKTNSVANAALVIKLAATLPHLPPIPEQAREHFVMGQTIFKSAKGTNDFALAGQEFSQAIHFAPWWPEARYNLAVAQEALGDYTRALVSLRLYQMFKLSDTEARAVQDKIYTLQARQKMAANEKAAVAQPAAQSAKATAMKSSPEVAVAPAKTFEQRLQELDGARFADGSGGTIDLLRGKSVILGALVDGRWMAIPNLPQMTLNGHKFSYTTSDGRWTFTGTISDDCETIEMTRYPDGASQGVYRRQH